MPTGRRQQLTKRGSATASDASRARRAAPKAQRDRLRALAQERGRSMSETFDAALDALRRADFHRAMAEDERRLREQPERLVDYARERDEWLSADLGGGA